MQHCSADATIFFKKNLNYFFVYEYEKTTLKSCSQSAQFFFSNANWPKTSHNLNFCSIKIAHRVTLMYNDFAYRQPFWLGVILLLYIQCTQYSMMIYIMFSLFKATSYDIRLVKMSKNEAITSILSFLRKSVLKHGLLNLPWLKPPLTITYYQLA